MVGQRQRAVILNQHAQDERKAIAYAARELDRLQSELIFVRRKMQDTVALERVLQERRGLKGTPGVFELAYESAVQVVKALDESRERLFAESSDSIGTDPHARTRRANPLSEPESVPEPPKRIRGQKQTPKQRRDYDMWMHTHRHVPTQQWKAYCRFCRPILKEKTSESSSLA